MGAKNSIIGSLSNSSKNYNSSNASSFSNMVELGIAKEMDLFMAARLMKDSENSCLIIVESIPIDHNGEGIKYCNIVKGILTERDIVRNALPAEKDHSVFELMTKDPECIEIEENGNIEDYFEMALRIMATVSSFCMIKCLYLHFLDDP